MKSKKASQGKKETKKTKKLTKASKPVAKKVKKAKPTKAGKPVTKKAKPAKAAPKSKPSKRSSVPLSKPIKTINKPVKATKIPELFKNFYREGERIFLRSPRKFASFPDLLDLQKRGYNDFIKKYINKLFNNINPVRDIA